MSSLTVCLSGARKGREKGIRQTPPMGREETTPEGRQEMSRLVSRHRCLSFLSSLPHGPPRARRREEEERDRQDVTNHTFGLTARSLFFSFLIERWSNGVVIGYLSVSSLSPLLGREETGRKRPTVN